MNDTPCTLCNHYRNELRLSVARREYDRIAWLENEQTKHRQTCETYNSQWFRGLWKTAEIGRDVEEVTK